jgi:hypothetical protein
MTHRVITEQDLAPRASEHENGLFLSYELITYKGTPSEVILSICIFQQNDGRYGFRIDASNGTGYSYGGGRGWRATQLRAFGRAAAWGNGGFPLDHNVPPSTYTDDILDGRTR